MDILENGKVNNIKNINKKEYIYIYIYIVICKKIIMIISIFLFILFQKNIFKIIENRK